ncbi:PASTA domain-containing protein [Solirubrobacter taibaiensis]|nr:PASTA domain-containing protein [Solirubrobacter taibaiensis]
MIRALSLALVAAALAPASAAADVTTTAITTPASPAYRLYEPNVKADTSLDVTGTSDGQAGDLLDVVCGGQRVAANIPVAAGGGFQTKIALGGFKPSACVLRAVPYKSNSKDMVRFTGPLVAVTIFQPRTIVTAVLESENPAPLDYELETGHQQGYGALGGASSGGLHGHWGVRADTLERFARTTWNGGARLDALAVDGRAAYVGGGIPRFDVDGRNYAPAGFEGVKVDATVDPATGKVVVSESARAWRCAKSDVPNPNPKECLAVIDTGVRLDRTVTFSGEHAIADVRDRWVSTDEQAHRVRVEYSHRAEANRWRFPGSPVFRAPEATEPGASELLVHDGTPTQAVGSLKLDPAPERFSFPVPSTRAAETLNLTTPTDVRRSFGVGENVIQQPEPMPQPGPGPGPGAPEDPSDPQPDHPGIYRCTVPKVKAGATVKAAQAAIKAGNCKVGTTRKTRSTKVKKGRVVALSRKAGTKLPRGTKVGIKVSRGRR